jgi:hypothetical protein
MQKILNALNVKKSELSDVLVCWAYRFLLQFFFVLCFTFLTAFFVMEFGVLNVVLLYLVSALFVLAGSYLFFPLVKKFLNSDLALFYILALATCLAVAFFISEVSVYATIFVLICALSVFFSQLEIAILGLIEDYFSPAQAQRVFPLIESGQHFGGMFAGVAFVFALAYGDIRSAIVLGILAMLLLAVLCRFYTISREYLPHIYEEKQARTNEPQEIRKSFRSLLSSEFSAKLAVLVCLFWVIFNLGQFHVTIFISEYVGYASNMGFAQNFATLFAKLEALLHLAALLFQILGAGRLIGVLGFAKSMQAHPLLIIGGYFVFLGNPGIFSGFAARTAMELANVLHLNAYHGAYYLFGHNFRKSFREILEGFLRPAGVILAMLVLFLLNLFVGEKNLHLMATVMIFFFAAAAFYQAAKIGKSFSKIALNKLLESSCEKTRIESMEILCQSGHEKPIQKSIRRFALNAMQETNLSNEFKKLLIRCAQKINAPKVEIFLGKMLSDNNKNIREKAWKYLKKQIIHKDKILQNPVFKSLTDEKSLAKNSLEINDFLLQALNEINPQKAEKLVEKQLKKRRPHVFFVRAARILNKKTKQLELQKFLRSKDFSLKCAAIVALQGKISTKELNKEIAKILHPKKKTEIKTMLETLSAINHSQLKKFLSVHLSSKNASLREYSIFKLAEKLDKQAIKLICSDLVTSEKHKEILKIKQKIEDLPHSAVKKIHTKTAEILTARITDFLKEKNAKTLNALSVNDLKRLKLQHAKIDDHEEMEKIQKIIEIKRFKGNKLSIKEQTCGNLSAA